MLASELQELQRKKDLDEREQAIRSEVCGLAARIEALESGFAAQLRRIEALELLTARVEALEKKAVALQTKK